MTLEHQREHPLLLLTHRAEGDGAGHIGGTLPVVGAGVQQQQSLRVQGHVRLRRGIVVDDGAVGAVAGDGVKAQIQKIRLLGAEGGQLGGGGQLRDGLLADAVLEPVQEAAHGRAVLDVGGAEIRHLLRRLAGLHQNGGAGLIQHLGVGQALHDAVVGGGAVGHDPRAGGQTAQHIIHIAVGAQGHAAGGQLLRDLRRDGLRLDAQLCVLPPDEQEGQKDRRTGHVAATQVQRPCDLRQAGEQQVGGVFLCHLLPQLGQLLLAGQTAAGQLPYGAVGQGGAVGPYGVHQIPVTGKADVLILQRIPQGTGKAVGDGAAVKAQHTALRQLLGQKRADGGDAGLSHAHQLDAAAGQLIRRLQKVAAIRPQSRTLRQDHQRTGGAGKAGQVGAGLEKVAHILRAVEVVRDHHIAVHAVLCHLPAQRCQTFCYDHSRYTAFPGGRRRRVVCRCTIGAQWCCHQL